MDLSSTMADDWSPRRSLALAATDEGDDTVYTDYVETTNDPGNTLLIAAIIFCSSAILFLPILVKFGMCCKRCRKRRRRRKAGDAAAGNDNNDDNDNDAVENAGGDEGGEDEDDVAVLEEAFEDAPTILGHVMRRRRGRGGHVENEDRRKDFVSKGRAREARASVMRREAAAGGLLDATIGGSVEVSIHSVKEVVSAEFEEEQNKWHSRHSERDDLAAEEEKGDTEEEEERDQIEMLRDNLSKDFNEKSEVANDEMPKLIEPDRLLEKKEGDQPENVIVKPPSPLSSSSSSSRHRRLSPMGKLRLCLKSICPIVRYDYETMRILRLAVPMTCSRMFETIGDLVILAIIAQFLGTDSMIAYTMTDVVVGVSGEFMKGWVEAVSSLGSMAYGARNYELVGQYVQTSIMGYALCQIPMAILWGSVIDKIILLMGFSQSVADLASEYVWIAVAIDIMEGINEAYSDFLEVIDKESFANAMDVLSSVADVVMVSVFAIAFEANLTVVGLVMVTDTALFFALNVIISIRAGWVAKFEHGLFGKLAFRDRSIFKDLVRTALPLALGSLLGYAEWEIMTVFAAVLGPAEAATWAILGFCWDIFESTTEAIGDAGEVRCAYQLGKGRPETARLSAYKTIFIATIMTLLVSAVFMLMKDVLPPWLTTDPTIRGMLAELFPLIAVGNVAMNMGMVCWALVGAQNRYHLATSVAATSSLLVTVPMGVIMSVWLRIDLQGLAFSVVVGDTCTATLLSACVIMSNWEKLSEKIQRMVAEEEGADSDSGSDDSSSSSGSSSSSSSSSDGSFKSCASKDNKDNETGPTLESNTISDGSKAKPTVSLRSIL